MKLLCKGIPASVGEAMGVARIVRSTDQHKIKEGDILVTEFTTPEFLPSLLRAGAIVTDFGGMTCHAAIISRELSIPCVVGCENATKVLKDGMSVRVDGNEGKIFSCK